MAETEADIAYEVVLHAGDGGSPTETFTDTGLEVTSITPPGRSRATQEATHMKSPLKHTELIFGFFTTKPVNVEFNFVASKLAAIMDHVDDGKKNWRIPFPDGSHVTFSAGITDFDIGAMTPGGKMSATAVITPTGPATWVQA